MKKKLLYISIFIFIILFQYEFENFLKIKLNRIDVSIIIPIFNLIYLILDKIIY